MLALKDDFLDENADYLSQKDKKRLDEALEKIKNGTAVLYTQEQFEQRMDAYFNELKNRAK